MGKFETKNENYIYKVINKKTYGISWDKDWKNIWKIPKIKINKSSWMIGWLKFSLVVLKSEIVPLSYWFVSQNGNYYSLEVKKQGFLLYRALFIFEEYKKRSIEYIEKSYNDENLVFLTKLEFQDEINKLGKIRCVAINYELTKNSA